MSHSFVIYLRIICGNLSGETFPGCSYASLSERYENTYFSSENKSVRRST